MSEEKKLRIKNIVTGEYEEVIPVKMWTPEESEKKEKAKEVDNKSLKVDK